MTTKKDQILDASLELFMKKGFDATSISDILAQVEIARGTLYYHFESKEAIMDAIIDRLIDQVLEKVQEVLTNHHLSHAEKFFAFFASMNLTQLTGSQEMLNYFNQPQNALFHEKSNQLMIENLTPALSQLIQEGITSGFYQTDFPDETAELILVCLSRFVDKDYQSLTPEVFEKRLESFLYNVSRMLHLSNSHYEEYRRLLFG